MKIIIKFSSPTWAEVKQALLQGNREKAQNIVSSLKGAAAY